VEWLDHRKIISKVFLTILVVIAIYAATTIYCWQRYCYVLQREHEISTRQMSVLQALADLRSGLNAHRHFQFEYLLAQSDTKKSESEKQLRAAATDIQAAQAKYGSLISMQDERARFDELTSNLAQYLTVSKEAMDFVREPQRASRHRNKKRKPKQQVLAPEVLFGPERNALNQTLNTLQIIAAVNSRTAEAASLDGNEHFASAQRAVQIAFAISSFLSLVVASLIGRMIVRPLHEVISATNAEDTGDLMLEALAEGRRDEVGELALCIGRLRTNQQQRIQAFASRTKRFANAIEPVSLAIKQQKEGIFSQQEQILQASETALEAVGTAKEISGLTNQAVETARHSAETVEKGAHTIETVQSQMRSIIDALGEISKPLQELGKSREQIAQFVSVIDDIAGQTNLLALNSAIEAARAGEHGRGFSVVAGEVMKLAERTTRATKEIGFTVTRIQAETQKAVAAVNEGTNLVENGVESTRKAGELLRSVSVVSQELGDSVCQIAKVAAKQTGSHDQLAIGLGRISNNAKNCTEKADQSAGALENLAGIAGELQRMISGSGSASAEITGIEAKEPALPLERKPLSTLNHGDRGKKHAVKGLALAAPLGSRPGVARIHARLLTPESDSESQRHVPSTASAGKPV
jgi:methyl-accepting chemotaxis protein